MKIKNSEMIFINQGKISAHFRANKFLKIFNWDAMRRMTSKTKLETPR